MDDPIEKNIKINPGENNVEINPGDNNDNRMIRFNLIIMLIILIFAVLFFSRRYLLNLIVRIKLKYNLIPTSLLDDDLSELESAQLLTNEENDEISPIKRNVNKLLNSHSASTSFEEAINTGLSSSNFDVHTNNIETEDERSGFDPKDIRILKKIMKKEHCDFDTARLVMQHLKFIKMGIDPSTGMPLDSKAYTFEPKSRR
ncbi:hypothetical protein BCR32DRAFT_221207 [Anaeromyces robustus]|uniref:Uncharacterized protein n=1 Tax=Anaeromyces robustus TaxID=1754192 RepID=A0A1Y1X2W8_9FUNG|nr:hypothetical protein BCR32DRAFT_221207 [Anaeromyces robustus]|eukprot:ORX80005.1 hypothetical protein BCR32DRAFT_221207 [Anaeromyces robustus]